MKKFLFKTAIVIGCVLETYVALIQVAAIAAMAVLIVWAVISSAAFGQTVEVYNIFGKRDDADWKNAARQVFITGGLENQRWLTIIRFDTTAPEQRGFDPCFTYAVCKYKPVVKKLPNGLWQISFTSEIAEGIP